MLIETLKRLEGGEVTPQPQDSSQATLAPMLKKEDGRIDWALDAAEIERRVRGFSPWPGTYTSFRGQGLHLWSAAVASKGPSPLDPGSLLTEDHRLLVACGGNTRLELKEVQLEGRRRISARDFLNGVRLGPEEKLGTGGRH